MWRTYFGKILFLDLSGWYIWAKNGYFRHFYGLGRYICIWRAKFGHMEGNMGSLEVEEIILEKRLFLDM
jgi:hypothetical protein